MLQLLFKGNVFLVGQIGKILAKIAGEINGQMLCLGGGYVAHGGNGGKGVVYEMRVDLREHQRISLRLDQLLLF